MSDEIQVDRSDFFKNSREWKETYGLIPRDFTLEAGKLNTPLWNDNIWVGKRYTIRFVCDFTKSNEKRMDMYLWNQKTKSLTHLPFRNGAKLNTKWNSRKWYPFVTLFYQPQYCTLKSMCDISNEI